MGKVVPLRPDVVWASDADARAVERQAVTLMELARAGALTGMAIALTRHGKVVGEELVGDVGRDQDLAFAATSRLKQRIGWPE